MASSPTSRSLDYCRKQGWAFDIWERRITTKIKRDGFGFIVRGNVNDLGYQSITTPGSLMAYWEAVERFGSRSWAEACQPAIEQAGYGSVLRPATTSWWRLSEQLGRAANESRLALTEDGRRIYYGDDGKLLDQGQTLRNPDMARTLERVAAGGAEVFYQGEIADEIDADMRANGGLLSKADLAAYRTTWTEPLWTDYRGLRVATNHPPGGGIQVVENLNILEHFDLAALGHNSAEYIRVVSEAMKRTTRDKDECVGDPAFFDVPLERLTSKSYAAELAGEIERGERASVERISGEPPDTTHVVVVDHEGNIVTMTHSLGMPSGVITPGLGYMFNGCMGVFDPRPGRAGSIAPGKSRFSSLCPTIVFRGDQPYVALGAPGGTQIAMGVTQAILNVVDHDMNMLEAVSAPRFSSTSNAIDVMNRIPRYITDELEADGYDVIRSPLSYGIAAVHGIRITEDGLDGGADPGLDGVALLV